MDPTVFFTALVSLFAIINPIGSIPVFVRLTGDMTAQERSRAIRTAVLVATSVLFLFAFAGHAIFDVFGITLPAFLIAGGILIGKYAFDLMHGERPKADATEKELADAMDRESMPFTPLGMPLLAGPGAITTIMLLTASTTHVMEDALIYLAILLVFAVAFAVLNTATFILNLVGRSGVMLVARIMGLILAAVAVQFVLTGLHAVSPELFPGVVQDPLETLGNESV